MKKHHVVKLSVLDLGLFRSPGPGLGNLLFPICRAYIAAKKNNEVFVKPTIRQIKIGPVLRREKDLRTYGDIFRHRGILDWTLWLLSKLGKKHHEKSASKSGKFIIYSGLKNQFHDLEGCSSEIKRFLISQSKYGIEHTTSYDVAIHIRQGDFSPAGTAGDGQSIQTSLDWYSKALDVAKSNLNLSNPNVVIFTDGDPLHIQRELGLTNVVIDDSKNALLSILRISEAKVIIGSRSTFSLWGAFLSEGISIWPKNFDLEKYVKVTKKHISI
tara:strand:+ start:299 stop:1111 length:813 start_codon:yes stop_codon:yes gene_type:complete